MKWLFVLISVSLSVASLQNLLAATYSEINYGLFPGIFCLSITGLSLFLLYKFYGGLAFQIGMIFLIAILLNAWKNWTTFSTGRYDWYLQKEPGWESIEAGLNPPNVIDEYIRQEWKVPSDTNVFFAIAISILILCALAWSLYNSYKERNNNII